MQPDESHWLIAEVRWRWKTHNEKFGSNTGLKAGSSIGDM